jgi:hypothetical protein
MADLVSELREMADHLWDVEHRINVDDDAKTLTAAGDEIERLNALVLDACKVFDHYDLPEHAFHYRRALLGLELAKAIARGEAPATTGRPT